MDALGRASLRSHPPDRLRAPAPRESRRAHSQVSIWRDWPPAGHPPPHRAAVGPSPPGGNRWPSGPRRRRPVSFEGPGRRERASPSTASVSVLPTSLCSGQVARMAAERLNAAGPGVPGGALPLRRPSFTPRAAASRAGPARRSTGGRCSGTSPIRRWPLALLLEHGCEKTHNDYMRAALDEAGIDGSRYGFASVQLDGGIEARAGARRGVVRGAAGRSPRRRRRRRPVSPICAWVCWQRDRSPTRRRGPSRS